MLKEVLGFKKLIFIDTETTGLSPANDRVIEIALIVVENGQVIDKFESLIKPDIAVSDEILKFTGIKRKDLKTAPEFDEVMNKVLELARGGLFIAHNAKFDYDFLDNEYKRRDIRFSLPQLCTVKLSRVLYPHFQKHDLDSVTRRLKIEIKARHRAMDDAFSLIEVVEKFQRSVSSEKFHFLAKPLIVEAKNSNSSGAIKQMGLL